MKVSCILCTYGRFSVVERSISFWNYQDYENKELIVFNTASESLELDESLRHHDIKIVNQSTETETETSYSSIWFEIVQPFQQMSLFFLKS